MSLLQELEDAKKQRAELNARQIEIAEEARRKLSLLEQDDATISAQKERLLNRLIKGESTGDRLLDFTLVHAREAGWRGEEAIKQYRALQAHVNANIGNPVLVLRQNVHRCGKDYAFARHGTNREALFPTSEEGFLYTVETQDIGKIAGKLDFDMSKGDILIPTQKHLTRESARDIFGWQVCDGWLKLENWHLPYLGKVLTATPSSEDDFGLSVFTGSKVDEFFNQGIRFADANNLGVAELKRIEKIYQGNGRFQDVSKYLAYTMLDLPTTQEAKQEYIEAVTPLGVDISYKLDRLRHREGDLVRSIEKVKAENPNGIVPRDEGDKVVNVPVEEYNASDSKELREVRETTKSLLNRAVHLQLPYLGIVTQIGTMGAQLPLSETLKLACQTYDVKV